jgi:hypothetical protein
MDRESAQRRLSPYPLSTFLVRCRMNNNKQLQGYAISLKTSDADFKHMKILNNLNDEVYLSDSRKFKSIVELISWYSRHSLKESFSGLDTTLRFPIKECNIVEAIHAYDPEASSPTNVTNQERNLLPLEIGERVVIIDKVSECQGWWKACNAFHRIGYIPKSFVITIQEEHFVTNDL